MAIIAIISLVIIDLAPKLLATAPLEEEIASLQSTPPSVQGDAREPLRELHDTLRQVGHYLNPYDPGSTPIFFTGAARSSRTVLAIIWSNEPEARWFVRDLLFCVGPFADKPASALKLTEAEWAGYLLRLSEADAASLDENLDTFWRDHNWDETYRGDRHAFRKFVAALLTSPSVSKLRSMKHDRYADIYSRVRAFLVASPNRPGEDPGDLTLAYIFEHYVKTQQAKKSEAIAVKLPLPPPFDCAIDGGLLIHVFGFMIAGLNYIGIVLWLPLRDKESRALKVSSLLGMEGHHIIFDTGCWVAMIALIVCACWSTLEVARKRDTSLLLWSIGISSVLVVLTWLVAIAECVRRKPVTQPEIPEVRPAA
jgi:hypothetical protein